MTLEGQLPEGLLDVPTGGPLGQPQGPVVVLDTLAGKQQQEQTQGRPGGLQTGKEQYIQRSSVETITWCNG